MSSFVKSQFDSDSEFRSWTVTVEVHVLPIISQGYMAMYGLAMP